MEAYGYKENYYQENRYGKSVKAYGYVRLSKDDYGEKRDSLENQKDIIKRFASDRGINLVEIIEDDDISGYKFKQRDGLEEIRSLIYSGECNMVIAKDLSRLGRDNANILLLVDFFEDHDVRYILPNDNFDSLTGDRSMLGIKAWYNDFYGRDISKKMRGTLHEIQKKAGLVILPPYGYKKTYDETGERFIELDEYAANVVKQMYNWYLEGNGMKNITKSLNRLGYQTPNNRKQQLYKKNFSKNSTNLWYHSTVKRILTDEAYTGVLVNRKTEIKKISTYKKRQLPESERIRHEGYFEQIISVEDFQRVQKLIEVHSRGKVKTRGPKIPHLFTGYIKCGDCGNSMIFNASKKKRLKDTDELVVYGGYICGHYHKFGKDYCSRHTTNERILKETILNEIRRIADSDSVDYDAIDFQMARMNKNKVDYEVHIKELEVKLLEAENKITNLVTEKVEGRIPEAIANKLIDNATKDYEKTNKALLKQKDIKVEADITRNTIKESIKVLKSVADKGEIVRSDVELLIEQITVFEKDGKKWIEFEWKSEFGRILQ